MEKTFDELVKEVEDIQSEASIIESTIPKLVSGPFDSPGCLEYSRVSLRSASNRLFAIAEELKLHIDKKFPHNCWRKNW